MATLIPMAGTDSAIFESCVFHDNQSARGGVLFINGGQWSSGEATLANTMVWHNDASRFPALRGRAAVIRSNVQGGLLTAQGNFSLRPLFRDAAARDLPLVQGTPGVGAASQVDLGEFERSSGS